MRNEPVPFFCRPFFCAGGLESVEVNAGCASACHKLSQISCNILALLVKDRCVLVLADVVGIQAANLNVVAQLGRMNVLAAEIDGADKLCLHVSGQCV